MTSGADPQYIVAAMKAVEAAGLRGAAGIDVLRAAAAKAKGETP